MPLAWSLMIVSTSFAGPAGAREAVYTPPFGLGSTATPGRRRKRRNVPKRAPGGLTMGQLSRRLMVSNGNVTGLIDRLVGEGLVIREPDPQDRRIQRVALTKSGTAAFAKMAPPNNRGTSSDFCNGTIAGTVIEDKASYQRSFTLRKS